MLITFACYLSLITGFMIKYKDLTALPIACCIFFLSAICILELLFYTYNNNKVRFINDLSYKAPDRKIDISELDDEKTHRRYVILENLLIDVGDFIPSHPGGRNLISDNLYTDIGRYVTGTQAYSSGIKAYSHNYLTMKNMFETLAYSEIVDNTIVVFNETDKRNYINIDMSIAEKRQIALSTYEYKFRNDNVVFYRFILGHMWIGKHFTVSSKRHNKTRYYSLCLALEEKYRQKLNMLLDNTINGYLQEIPKLESQEIKSNSLHLYIKRYKYTEALSDELYEQKGDFRIKGPMVSIPP
jgi:hypothetical protein